MSIITSGTFQALASVTVDGITGAAAFLAAAPPALTPVCNAGFSNVSNGGVGLKNLTLDQEVDALQSVMLATPRSTVPGAACQTVHTSDAVKQVRTYAAGVLADGVNFDVALLRMPN